MGVCLSVCLLSMKLLRPAVTLGLKTWRQNTLDYLFHIAMLKQCIKVLMIFGFGLGKFRISISNMQQYEVSAIRWTWHFKIK